MNKARLSIAAVSMAGLALTGVAPAAHATDDSLTSEEAEAIEQLEEELQSAADDGDTVASASLDSLDDLTNAETVELAEFLTSDASLADFSDHEGAEVQTAVDTDETQNRSSTTRRATCTSTFTFLGINVTRMEITGTYTVSNGSVTSTNSMAMSTLFQYEPTASTTYSNISRTVTAAGNAQFQGTATVDRLAGSRSGDYRMTAYASGSSPSCGWV